MNITSGLKSPLIEANRILVIGCPGSGKSTFATRLSRALDLDYISMDRDFYWQPGWRKRPRDEIDRRIARAVAEQRWIMDGTGLSSFHLRLPRADAVIWLRLPRYACLYGATSRAFRYFGPPEAALQDHGLASSTVIIRSRKAANRFAALSA
jgi:adenylate kinase family enzyme